jgi:hypothetical protein
VPPHSELRVEVAILNQERYVSVFEGAECDLTLVLFGTDGSRTIMEGNVPFTREGFKRYVPSVVMRQARGR